MINPYGFSPHGHDFHQRYRFDQYVKCAIAKIKTICFLENIGRAPDGLHEAHCSGSNVYSAIG